VILLHKFPADPILQQLLDLIRSTTQNERIYAESCETSASSLESIQSIRAFTKKWNLTHKTSPLGDDLGAEPIDTLILSDDESLEKNTGFGTPQQARLDYYNASLKGKIILVSGLLPALRNSKTRVVNVVAPFYAASPPLDPPSTSSSKDITGEIASPVANIPWRSFQPWTFSAPSSLCSIAAFRHLAASEIGPAKDVPPSIIKVGARDAKMTVVSVSTGLTRSWLVGMFTGRSPILGWPLCLLLSPLIFVIGKSMPDATKEVERAIHGDFLDLHKHPNGVTSGSLIVRGQVVGYVASHKLHACSISKADTTMQAFSKRVCRSSLR